MKLGISVSLDVTKIDKSRIFVGAKGKYLDLTMFIDTDEVSQYGSNGTISQSVSQEERANGVKLPILGNGKIFYTSGGDPAGNNNQQRQAEPEPEEDSTIPF